MEKVKIKMKILIDINHPAHVHLFRNFYHLMSKGNHKIIFTIRNVESIRRLLNIYNIEYIILGDKRDSLINKAFDQLKFNFNLLKIIKENNSEIVMGSSMNLAHVSKLSKVKSVLFDDDDDKVEPLMVKFAHPFCDSILSPNCSRNERKSKKALFYKGYHELAYLHPDQFIPDEKILKEVGIKKNDNFFIMRFNAFKAHHDIGVSGISLENKLKLIELLKQYGKIFITTERNIEPELKEYQLHVSPEKIHSLMAFSTMFLGDSQTMTSEAAVLGIPSVRCNDFVGRISYLEEEEHKYKLTFGFKPSEFDKLLARVKELLEISNLREEFQDRRKKLLKDKIDVTAFMVWFIENYPKSVKIMKENPDYQDRFK